MDSSNIEAIKNQERLIEKEIAEKIPFVSQRIPIQELKDDYSIEDDIYQNKIKHLEKDYECIRRTRPDGNCFFRAFGFAYFESLLLGDEKTEKANREELDKFIEFTKRSKEELINLGLPSVTIEDFFEVFLETLLSIKSKETPSSEKLLEKFCDQTTSDYIVVYFRLITSGYLQQNSEKFATNIYNLRSLSFCQS